jgi:hypothetical protein
MKPFQESFLVMMQVRKVLELVNKTTKCDPVRRSVAQRMLTSYTFSLIVK